MNENQLTVAIIGLGNMGSALARAIAAARHDVTVWNRSDAKCQSLAEQGAAVAASVHDAVAGSDVIIVCVRGYDVANSLLRDPDVATALTAKTVIQLGNGVPTEVADAAEWFAGHGVAYLDGSIMAFPESVGSPDCQVLVSGDPVAFDRCRPFFDAIGGDIRFLGSDPTASAVINSSALAFLYVAAHAFVSAAAMCDASDAPIDLLAEVVGTFTAQMPALFGGYVDMIESGDYDSTTLRLASGADNLRAVAEFGRQTGVDTGLFDEALRTLDAAVASDRGVNLAAIFEELRTQSVESRSVPSARGLQAGCTPIERVGVFLTRYRRSLIVCASHGWPVANSMVTIRISCSAGSSWGTMADTASLTAQPDSVKDSSVVIGCSSSVTGRRHCCEEAQATGARQRGST